MRIVLVVLIILNLLYFLWQTVPLEKIVPQEKQVSAVTSKAVAVPTITMIKDVIEERRKDEPDQADTDPLTNDGDNCMVLGPFEDILPGQDVSDRLSAMGLVVHLRAIDEPTGEYDFRLMLPPAASLEDAFRKRRELQAQDIVGHVITEGRDEFAISLGVYSSEDAVKAAQVDHANSGYKSIVARIPRLNRSYWVITEDGIPRDIPENLIEELQSKFEQVSLDSMICPRT